MTNSSQNLTAAKVHLTILFATCSVILTSVANAERPNVVILFTDDHGTLDANCYGSTDLITPSIDELAASGVRFTQAYAHKVCCPARAALLTGRHPQRSDVTNWTQGNRHGSDARNTNMKAEEVTIAEALKSGGYETALFGKWHLGAKLGHGPLDQGFDRFFGHLGGFIDNYRHYFLHGKGFHDLYDNDKEVFHRGEYFPDMMVERAVDYIGAKRDAPFFMMVAFNLPHYPEQPIGKYAAAYADLPMPRQSYARVVSTVDDYIGRVIDKLQETGQRENTIVILMGDNGHSAEDKAAIDIDDHTSGYPKGHYYSAHGGGGNTGKWIGQKASFLEGGIRVPAIISYPKVLPKGEVRDQIVTAMDWFPTILDLAEIAPPKVAFDGKSMMPLIRDASTSTAHDILHFSWANEWAVRQGDWKLIGRINKSKPDRVHKSLHNLAGAEPEVKDHAADHPDIVERLTDLHNEWAKEVMSE